MSSENATVAEQEYLEIMFWLEEAGLPMTGANIARAMQLSPPTVHEMIGRLERDGYVSRRDDKSLEFTADGKKLFCSGAGDEVVHSFDFADGVLANHQRIHLRPAGATGVPAGLAVDRAGQQLYAANVYGHRISRVQLGPEPKVSDIPLGGDTNGTKLVAIPASNDFDTAAAHDSDIAARSVPGSDAAAAEIAGA